MDVKEVLRSDPAVATVLAGRTILLLGDFVGDRALHVFGEFDGELAGVTIEFVGPEEDS